MSISIIRKVKNENISKMSSCTVQFINLLSERCKFTENGYFAINNYFNSSNSNAFVNK